MWTCVNESLTYPPIDDKLRATLTYSRYRQRILHSSRRHRGRLGRAQKIRAYDTHRWIWRWVHTDRHQVFHRHASTSTSAVRFWIFINRFGFGFGLKQRFRFRFQNRHSTTFKKKYNQPLTCLRSANKPTSLQQSSTRHSMQAIKAN